MASSEITKQVDRLPNFNNISRQGGIGSKDKQDSSFEFTRKDRLLGLRDLIFQDKSPGKAQ